MAIESNYKFKNFGDMFMKKMSRAIISTVLICALAFVSLASCKKDVPIDTTPATVKKATDELELPEATVTSDKEVYNLPNSVITDGRIVEVEWTVKDDLNTSKLQNNILTVNKDLLKNTVKLTANLSLNNQKKSKDFTINLEPITEFYANVSWGKLKITFDSTTTPQILKYKPYGSDSGETKLGISITPINKSIEITDSNSGTKQNVKYEIQNKQILLTTMFNRDSWTSSLGIFICDQFDKPIKLIYQEGQEGSIIDFNTATPTTYQIQVSENKDSITLTDGTNNKKETWNVSVLKEQDGIKLTKGKDERIFLFKGAFFEPDNATLE